jgi:hypothetical protein
MTGITESIVAAEFMKRIAIPMSKFNKDGIGYTAVKPDGSMFSQRWHKNKMFMETKDVMTPALAEQLAPYASRLLCILGSQRAVLSFRILIPSLTKIHR